MIVAGLETQNSAFFSIESPDIKLPQRILNEDIISFTYEEEMGRYSTGTLSVNDPTNYYADILRMGARFNISFGYTSPDLSINSALLAQKNPDQILGGLARTGIKGYVMNPSGKGGEDGKVVYNCNFYGGDYITSSKKYRTHSGMTKTILVQQLLLELGVIPAHLK